MSHYSNTFIVGLINDGLWDIYNNQHMGVCGESCATQFKISREEQDRFAVQSYSRAAAAWKAGLFNAEVAPITVPGGKGPGVVVSEDEEYTNIKIDKIPQLKPAFKKDGSVTAANSSTLNDGAAAMIVMSGREAKRLGCTPLFRIKGFGDAARDPVEFTIAPSDAVPRAAKMAGVAMTDIEYHEINEAFAVVALANMQ